MNIVACIKRVPLTDVQFKPGPDGKSLDTAGFGYMTSFYDEIAVEEAIRTKEKVGGEVRTKMGEDMVPIAKVTAWDPPHHFATEGESVRRFLRQASVGPG